MKKTILSAALCLASCGFIPQGGPINNPDANTPFGANKPSSLDRKNNGTIPLTRENTLKLIQECLSYSDTSLVDICNEPDRFGDDPVYPIDACFPNKSTYTIKYVAVEVSKSKINPPYKVDKQNCPIVTIDNFDQHEPTCLKKERDKATNLAITTYFDASNPNSEIMNTAQYKVFQENCQKLPTITYDKYQETL